MTALKRVPPLAQFEESPLRRQIIERLRRSAVGELVTYSELSALVGEDVQRKARHLLTSAQKALLHERVVFGVVTNVGVKRLDDIGIVDRVESGAGRIHRAAQRGRRILTLAAFDRLPPEDQQRYRLLDIRTGVIAQFGGKKMETRLLRAVEATVTVAQLKAAISGSLDQF